MRPAIPLQSRTVGVGDCRQPGEIHGIFQIEQLDLDGQGVVREALDECLVGFARPAREAVHCLQDLRTKTLLRQIQEGDRAVLYHVVQHGDNPRRQALRPCGETQRVGDIGRYTDT